MTEAASRRVRLGEVAGAVADLGVLVPIAVSLVLVNGLSATAVLLPAGLLYIASGAFYRVPVPVQPLKAFGAIAVAQGLGSEVIAAGAILMGVIFLPLGASGLLDKVAALVPVPVVRGVQLCVGLVFAKLAWTMVSSPPASVADPGLGTAGLTLATLGVVVLLVVGRKVGAALLAVLVAVGVMLARWSGPVSLGPDELVVGIPPLEAFATAAVLLVLPQLPLTFANSCIATADVARRYFGERASRVRPGRLAMSLGAADIGVGLVAGMPLCHGAGGMTAHRSFGARTGAGTAGLGVVLAALALLLGTATVEALRDFPLWILAGLLVVAGLLHVALLRDLEGWRAWVFALGVGLVGFLTNLAWALVLGLLLWWVTARRGEPFPRR